MILTPMQTLIMIAAIALGTMLTRFAPFILFPDNKPVPPAIEYVGKILPPAMMGLLVVYCLRNVSLTAPPHGIPEILAIAITAGLHLWRRNVLLSIGAGTLSYMLLLQLLT